MHTSPSPKECAMLRSLIRRRILVAALLELLVCLLLPAWAGAQAQTRELTVNQARSYEWPTITVNFNLKSLDNSALGPVGPDQFTIEENGVPQQVSQVALAHDLGVPLSVVMVLDTSGSMAGPKLAAAQQAGITFMQTLNAADDIAFLSFSTRVPAASPFTQDRTVTASAFNEQVASGDTALYDALYSAARLSNTAKE